MLRERFGRAERDREAEDLEVVEEGKRLLLPAADVERDQRAGPRLLLPVDRVFGIVRQKEPDVADLAHLGVRDEERGDPPRVALLLLGADFERLERSREEPGRVR